METLKNILAVIGLIGIVGFITLCLTALALSFNEQKGSDEDFS